MSPDLKRLLRTTSRSFYLTLRVLPRRVRPQIGLAYLLARTTDTVADTDMVPLPQRLDALEQLRQRILGRRSDPLNFGILAKHQNLPAERMLIERAEESLSLLQTFSAADQQRIRGVLDIVTGGQELDLQRFEGASGDNIIALRSAVELDDYTYRVAGCVGEFWTQICRAHMFPHAELEDAQLFGDSIRFGKGLQLINILRDLPADLHKGRCYLPSLELEQAGLMPSVLLSPVNEPRFRPIYQHYLDIAESHLQAGWNYTNALPRRQVRIRLACAWPILIGARTIQRLRGINVLELRQGVKISRGEVYSILLHSILAYPVSGVWRRLFVVKRKAVANNEKLR